MDTKIQERPVMTCVHDTTGTEECCTAHFNAQGELLPPCRRCKLCGTWVPAAARPAFSNTPCTATPPTKASFDGAIAELDRIMALPAGDPELQRMLLWPAPAPIPLDRFREQCALEELEQRAVEAELESEPAPPERPTRIPNPADHPYSDSNGEPIR